MTIPKGATIDYGEYIEMYRGTDGCLMIWYRNPQFGPEWPSMCYRMVVLL